MSTLQYFENTGILNASWFDSLENLKGKLIGEDTYRIRSDTGETLTFYGEFQRAPETGVKLALQLADAVFRDADGNKVAEINDIGWHAQSSDFFKIRDACASALSYMDKYVGSIGNDHVLTWSSSEYSKVYGLAGNDVITFATRHLLDDDFPVAQLYDGGLGRDTLDFSRYVRTDDDQLDPNDVYSGIAVSATEGIFGTDRQIASLAHFEKYIGTRYADTFEGCDKAETFDARGSQDDMTGGGGADRFIFGIGYNNDVIQDFEIGEDKIVIRRNLGFENFAQLKDFMTEQQGTTTIDFGADDVLMIRSANGESLSAGDFIFN